MHVWWGSLRVTTIKLVSIYCHQFQEEQIGQLRFSAMDSEKNVRYDRTKKHEPKTDGIIELTG